MSSSLFLPSYSAFVEDEHDDKNDFQERGKAMVHRTCVCLLLSLAWGTARIVAAQEAGMKPEGFKAAIRLIEEEVESGLVGAAALLVAHNDRIVVEQGFGSLSRKPGAEPCRSNSVFLVASISKPVTAMAVMRLVDEGRISLDDPAQKYLPEFTGSGRERITIRNLLSHTSGLPDMLPDNIDLRKRQAPLKDFVAGALHTPLLFTPGTGVSYQSMGILLVSETVERVSGMPLDRFLQREVFGPLKMPHSTMGIGKRKIEDTVQCDLPAQGDLRMKDSDASWNWNSPYWRRLGVPWGGMHTTVGDIYRLLQAMLDKGRPILKPELGELMVSNQNAKLDKPWGLGWAMGENAFYDGSPGKAFGHSGATGTLCWADPERRLVFVLFTNRPLANDPGNFLRQVAKRVSDAAGHER
ncbi:MAG: beta-lactamase family protein [Acidobacteria bacterium]|nr:beta-lactamase family protein [Acidobacteriota bacterium]